ncbi:MAG TPA: two-component regulator propeller domain-containing protein [bacterium]|nr:two-component regulator propeller domain-containing protein [bacterium]
MRFLQGTTMAAESRLGRTLVLAGGLALAWAFCAAAPLSTVEPGPQLNFTHYSLDEGLSQSIVFAIHKDRRGFMWFGTESGLNRFDGYQFTTFYNLAFDSTSISANNITSICEDDSGYLWIGTAGGGLNRMDWRTERFTHFHFNPADSTSLGAEFVGLVFIDSRHTLWALTNAGGLDRFDAVHSRFIRYRHDPRKTTGLDHNTVLSLHLSREEDRLWIGTAAGLNYYDRAADQFRRYLPAAGTAPWQAVRNIYEGRSEPGILWIATGAPGMPAEGRGLFRLDTRSGQITRFEHRRGDPRSLPTNAIFGMLEDSKGAFWLQSDQGIIRLDRRNGRWRQFLPDPGHPAARTNSIRALQEMRNGMMLLVTYATDGLWAFDPQSGTFAHYQHDPADPGSLSNDDIISAYQDTTGVLWLGSNTGGLNKLEFYARKFQHYTSRSGDVNSLGFPLVRAICLDHEGYLWVGCSRAGLHRYSRDRRQVQHYRYDSADRRSLSNDNVWALCEDHEGVLWAGTYGGGLNRYDRTHRRFDRYLATAGDSSSLGDNFIRTIFEDSKQRLWIGTERNGLNRFDRERRAFIQVKGRSNDNGSGSVRAIAEDGRGRLWLGTFGGGLEVWDPGSGARRVYRNNPQDTTTLCSDYIQSIAMDAAGQLWIGTFGGGLDRFDAEREQFRHFTAQNSELADNAIYAVLCDPAGRIWCSSNRGLSCYDPGSGTFHNYDVYHGLQSKEFNGQAGFRGANGELFFGGINGFNAFFPDQVENNPYPPQVALTGLQIFGQPVPIAANSVLRQHIAALKEIHLSHKQNDLTFEFVALHYSQPQENGYAYQLEKYDARWRSAGSQRSATYTNLSPGRYRFHVIARNSDGVWNKEGASIAVIIHPPWWKTPLACLLFTTLFAGAALSLYRFQHARLVKREQEKAQVLQAELRAQAAEAQARAVQAENERQHHELEEARRLQLSMLPRQLPEVPDLDIAVFMETATEVGGDYYDFRLTPDGVLTVAVGDATGHGLKAGTMVSVLKGLFTAYGANGHIGDFFEICTRTIRQMHLGNLYMGLALARLKGAQVLLSAAGMPPSYLYHQASGEVEEITLKGMPLGAFTDYPYQQIEKKLEPGDALLLLSDGLAEVFDADDEIFDYPRVRSAFADAGHLAATEIIRSLQATAQAWRNGRELHDDITLVVLKRKGSPNV